MKFEAKEFGAVWNLVVTMREFYRLIAKEKKRMDYTVNEVYFHNAEVHIVWDKIPPIDITKILDDLVQKNLWTKPNHSVEITDD